VNTRLKHIQNWPQLAKEANWSVKAMATRCDVTVRTLEIHFRKVTGNTPKAWLVQQRQKQAKELLSNGVSVKEIAAELGFKQAHHFSREFKKCWGVCPTQTPSAEHKMRVLV